MTVTDLDSDLSLFSVGNSALGFEGGARTVAPLPGLGCSIDEKLVEHEVARGSLSRELLVDRSF